MTREELLKIAKPILFNTEMVKAILEDRKTVTRRIVNPKLRADEVGFHIVTNKATGIKRVDTINEWEGTSRTNISPFHEGDYLYVRESVFQGVAHSLDMSGETVGFLTDDFEYFADGIHQKDHWKDKHQNVFMRRRPSIHMPKEAARIFLKVTDVRVERLQDIMKSPHGPNNQVVREGCTYGCDFIAVWESTIKKTEKDTYGWEANPWVWVIEFERVEV